MRFMSLSVGIVAVLLAFAQIAYTQTINKSRPLLLEDSDYTEYWEQYFYLDDGSLVTSQFLVANFPWPVGDDHGIMLGTLVTPDGKLYVIKNGRDFGEWGFKEDALDLFIHTHRIKKKINGYSTHLENTMGIVDLELSAPLPNFDHKRFNSENGFIEASFYAPLLQGHGNWQLGPEAGFDPAGPVHNTDFASGFGVHVIMNDKVDMLIDNWVRVVGVSKEGSKPFLSAIDRPDGTKDIIFKIIDNNIIDEFTDIKIEYDGITQEKDATYPKQIKISAKGKNGTISGTIKYGKKFSHFNLTEHLNFFEKSFAKSNPTVTNFRYLADYELVYKTSEGEEILKGKALSEYMDIQPAKKAPARKRRRNRR